MKRLTTIVLATGLLASCVGQALGRSVEVEATEMAVIKPSLDSNESRCLFRFSLPDVLKGCCVDFACASLKADCVGEEEGVSFQAFAVTKDWAQETVGWQGSWYTPGGDFDKRLSSYWISEAGEGEILYFDITQFVNDWLKAPSKNFGIIVKVSGPFLGTFAVDGAVKPKLRILY